MIAGVAGVCFVAGLASYPAAVSSAGSVISPALGVAAAALLIFGYEVGVGILFGVFCAGLLRPVSPAVAAAIAFGDALGALAAWHLAARFARGREAFERARDVFRFVLASLAGAAVSATIGLGASMLSGSADSAKFWSEWLVPMLGDAAAMLVVTPLLLFWWENPRVKWTREQGLELGLLFLGLFAAAFTVFGGVLPAEFKNYGLEYLCLPFLVWAAFRFGRRETATALFVLTAIAAGGTAMRSGSFALDTPATSLLRLALFAGVVGVITLALGAEVWQRRRADEQAKSLAISDPLTGLANYRQMVEALESEIKRFNRTERPFIMLLIDVDGLKKINDAHGHLAGSRALCRLADMLRLHSREMDTAARYGGDEFVLILPETDADAARLVAQRISKRLAEDGEEPKLTVSIGTAICPDDGETIHEILNAADRDLYREKGVPKRKFVLPS